jgi:hypothetical protein
MLLKKKELKLMVHGNITTEDSRRTVKIFELRALGSPILAKSALTKIWSSLVRIVLGIDALIRVVLGLSTGFFLPLSMTAKRALLAGDISL